ncbi:DMT family transporter [Anthocerotibacter panamensis]|uniref:DMT family transporter n=1 Tax=Anthocerotibacter panamensis TaxID=2857077 RepID=UPI001C40334F|nr:DMT family transporter [Anthocerotibacter panamensis]
MVLLNSQRSGLLYAVLAVLLFSTSPVLIRWAAPLSAYEITAGRLAVAALAVLAVARSKGIARQDWLAFAGFGLVTALHFLLYSAALSFTTVAHALALVYTAPVFVTLASVWLLREPIERRKGWGMCIVVLGVVILAGFEPRFTGAMVVGDLLALGSAVMFGLYSVAGRSQRTRYPLLTYAGFVYGLASLWALPAAFINFTPQGYGTAQIASVVALGLLPLGIGHTLYNAALRRTHATYVNLIATQEVTGGVLLGVLLLQEIPTPQTLLGLVVMLLGAALLV